MLVFADIVIIEGLGKLTVHESIIPGAVEDVVALVDGAFGSAVEEACGKLGGSVGRQSVELADKVLYLGANALDLMADGAQGLAKVGSSTLERLKQLSKHYPTF